MNELPKPMQSTRRLTARYAACPHIMMRFLIQLVILVIAFRDTL